MERFACLSVFFAAVKFSDSTVSKIFDFCENHNIPNRLERDEFHSSLSCSKRVVENFKRYENLSEEGYPLEFDIFISRKNAFKPLDTYCLVLKYQSDYMTDRFHQILRMGGTHDYDNYIPHITLSYDVGANFKIENLPNASTIGVLNIIEEYFTTSVREDCLTCEEFINCYYGC